jgi:hypothetical protein
MAANLKLESYSDREILHIVDDLRGDDGWVSVNQMATRIGLSVDGMSDEQLALHTGRCISVRLAWIKKLSGCIERHPEQTNVWGLTDLGREVVSAKLSQAIAIGIDQMGASNTLLALDAISRRYRRADVKAANLMRREWQFGTHRSRK